MRELSLLATGIDTPVTDATSTTLPHHLLWQERFLPASDAFATEALLGRLRLT